MKYFSFTELESKGRTWYGSYDETGEVKLLFSLNDNDENDITFSSQKELEQQNFKIYSYEPYSIYLTSIDLEMDRDDGYTQQITEQEFLLAIGAI